MQEEFDSGLSSGLITTIKTKTIHSNVYKTCILVICTCREVNRILYSSIDRQDSRTQYNSRVGVYWN